MGQYYEAYTVELDTDLGTVTALLMYDKAYETMEIVTVRLGNIDIHAAITNEDTLALLVELAFDERRAGGQV